MEADHNHHQRLGIGSVMKLKKKAHAAAEVLRNANDCVVCFTSEVRPFAFIDTLELGLFLFVFSTRLYSSLLLGLLLLRV